VEKKTILVVDNGEEIRETLTKILEREGYQVLSAQDGQSALEILRESKINIIISDVAMPRMDGPKLLKAAKHLRPEVEVILMTGHGKSELGMEALKEGAFDFIHKPFTKLALTKTVKQALEKQSLAMEVNLLKDRIRDLVSELMDLIGDGPVHQFNYSRSMGTHSTH
jgi:DNA-binding NtrC family response regulator